MIHDPLCPLERNPLARECRICALIEVVREDERERMWRATEAGR